MHSKSALQELEEKLKELQESRKTLVVPLLMDEASSIDYYTVSEVYEQVRRALHEQKAQDIDVIIHSGGGDADAAYHIAVILQELCKGKLTMIVPRFAKSAATLLACGGDVIVMDLPSELGPLDPQVQDPTSGRWVSVSSIEGTLKYLSTLNRSPLLEELCKRIPILEVGDYQRIRNHMKTLLKDLLIRRMFKDDENKEAKAEQIATQLVEGYSYHGKAITKSEAEQIGLKVEQLPEDQWKLVWEIFRIFEKEVLVRG